MNDDTEEESDSSSDSEGEFDILEKMKLQRETLKKKVSLSQFNISRILILGLHYIYPQK